MEYFTHCDNMDMFDAAEGKAVKAQMNYLKTGPEATQLSTDCKGNYGWIIERYAKGNLLNRLMSAAFTVQAQTSDHQPEFMLQIVGAWMTVFCEKCQAYSEHLQQKEIVLRQVLVRIR